MSSAVSDSSVEEHQLSPVALERDRRIAQLSLAILLIPTLWFQRGDLQAVAGATELLTERTGVRFAFLLILCAGIWSLGRFAHDRRTYERLLLAIGLGTAACIVALNALRPAGSSLPLRTPLMWLFVYYAGLVSRPRLQVLPALIISVGLIVLRLTRIDGSAAGDVAGDIVVIVTVNAIGLQLVHQRAEAKRRERALIAAERLAVQEQERTRSELARLRGIIPICSYCRVLRTEDGEWQRFEEYVHSHSDVEFSHGICPECLTRHFPEHSSQ